jgi:hypothetical protein
LKSLLIVGVLLCCSVASGQGFELRAGVSNLLDADGASAIYSTENFATEVDLGIAQNRFVYGAGIHFQRRGCDWFIGDHQEAFSTTVAGLSVASRGVAMECKTKNQSLRVFTGAVGDLHSTPYFTATESRQFGSGVEYTRIFGDVEFQGVTAFAGANHVFLESVKYHHNALRVEEAAGLALGKKYFEGQASYQTRHISATVTHADYFGIATVNSEQVTAGSQHVSVFASAFQSKYSGTALGANASYGRVSGTVMTIASGGQRQTNEFITEQVSQRFSLNQSISGRNVGFGGSMTGNLLSASVSYQEVFTPTSGFERAMVVSLRLQLTRGTVNVSVDKLPSGMFYTGYAGIVASGPALGNGQQDSHAAP